MKVGDVVRQGNCLAKANSLSKSLKSKRLGTVVAIYESVFPEDFEITSDHKEWLETVGRRVDVVWAGGRSVESFAENFLEIVPKDLG